MPSKTPPRLYMGQGLHDTECRLLLFQVWPAHAHNVLGIEGGQGVCDRADRAILVGGRILFALDRPQDGCADTELLGFAARQHDLTVREVQGEDARPCIRQFIVETEALRDHGLPRLLWIAGRDRLEDDRRTQPVCLPSGDSIAGGLVSITARKECRRQARSRADFADFHLPQAVCIDGAARLGVLGAVSAPCSDLELAHQHSLALVSLARRGTFR